MENKVIKVLCIRGEEGILKENEIYHVCHTTINGNYILLEADPPFPYTSFDNSRFVLLDNTNQYTIEDQYEFEDYIE